MMGQLGDCRRRRATGQRAPSPNDVDRLEELHGVFTAAAAAHLESAWLGPSDGKCLLPVETAVQRRDVANRRRVVPWGTWVHWGFGGLRAVDWCASHVPDGEAPMAEDEPKFTPEERVRREAQGEAMGRGCVLFFVVAIAVIAVAMGLSSAGVFDSEDDVPSRTPARDDFRTALENGADCLRLFEIRNSAPPDDPRLPGWNRQLRAIGCHSANSTRTD